MAGKIFGKINNESLDEIKFGGSRVTLYDKTLNLQLAIFTKNHQLPNLIPCQIFCLYGIMFNKQKQAVS